MNVRVMPLMTVIPIFKIVSTHMEAITVTVNKAMKKSMTSAQVYIISTHMTQFVHIVYANLFNHDIYTHTTVSPVTKYLTLCDD